MQPVSSEAGISLPDAQDIREGIEAVELKETERRKWLASVEALSERKASRSAYADLSVAGAQELLLNAFSKQFEQLDSDPARFLSEVKILKSFGGSIATISDGGDTSLLDAGIPVSSEDEAGEARKVDLSLLPTATGFEPVNPLVNLRIPESAAQTIEVGESGLGVSAVAVDGERSAHPLGDKDIFYPEVQTDTDLIVSPIAAGVEIFNQLRSPESPEELRFKVDLPEEATLRDNGVGGAEIVKGEEVVAIVPFSTAVDAQGTEVAVELRIDADTIVLEVPHREEDLAYPILVDPAIQENAEYDWYGGGNTAALDTPGIWSWNSNSGGWVIGDTWCLRAELCSPSGRGLFASTVNGTLPANLFGQWSYTAPGQTAYIPSIYPTTSAVINPFWRHNYTNCPVSRYPHPYDYNGMWDGANWTWLETDRAQWYGNAMMYSRARTLIFGINTGNGGNVPCWRNIMAGGVAIRLDDPETPSINSVSGFPRGWVGDRTAFTINVNASDPGLGVRNVVAHPAGALPIYYTKQQDECPGTKTKPCPASLVAAFPLNTTQFDQGKTTSRVFAYDPTTKSSPTSNGICTSTRHRPTSTSTANSPPPQEKRAAKNSRPETGKT